jgi:RimJ/RimL family protein N-acetyltransferase
LLTDWLFREAGAEGVQAGTETRNAAMRRVLEALGFRLEGIMRAFGAASDGTRFDGAMYAVVRQEWSSRPDYAASGTAEGSRRPR